MNDESSKIKGVVARGKQRFFQQYPQLLQEVETTVNEQADRQGSNLNELREVAQYRAIAGVAKKRHTDSLALLLELGANSKEELAQLIAAQNVVIKKSIGM